MRVAIVASTDRLLEASGRASFTVFDACDAPRIELTVTAPVAAGSAGEKHACISRRLPDEIRQLADDVRLALIADRLLVEGARQIVIDIQLRGPRPSFDIIYRTHHS